MEFAQRNKLKLLPNYYYLLKFSVYFFARLFSFVTFWWSAFLDITALSCVPYVIFAAAACSIWYIHYILIFDIFVAFSYLDRLNQLLFVSRLFAMSVSWYFLFPQYLSFFVIFVILVCPLCLSLRYNCCYSCCCRMLKLHFLFSLYFSFASALNRCFGILVL